MQKEELASPADASNTRLQTFDIASRRSALPCPCIEYSNAHDAPPAYLRGQRPRYSLNFWKFRHRFLWIAYGGGSFLVKSSSPVPPPENHFRKENKKF
jgi:hypothetical protein